MLKFQIVFQGPEDARRRPQGDGRRPALYRLHRGEPGTGGKGFLQPGKAGAE